MALRKEDMYYNDDKENQTKKRSRITIDVSPELRRRIKMAATQNDLSISEYLGRILEEAVPQEVNTVQRKQKRLTRETLEDIYRVHEEIKQHTQGKVFEDSSELIHQMREERSRELDQL